MSAGETKVVDQDGAHKWRVLEAGVAHCEDCGAIRMPAMEHGVTYYYLYAKSGRCSTTVVRTVPMPMPTPNVSEADHECGQ